MKALSIRQPWAWAIIHAGKDIENRSWPTRFRGRFLVHASQGMTAREYMNFIDDLRLDAPYAGAIKRAGGLPPENDLQRGGIVGSVELVDCVSQSASPWFSGPYGFVLANPEPLPFRPLKGKLGFFETDVMDLLAIPAAPPQSDLFAEASDG